MALRIFSGRTLCRPAAVPLTFAFCLLLASLAGSSAVQAQELPGRRQVLEMLGYEVVEPGTPGQHADKPQVQINIPRTTPVRVVSSNVTTPLERDRDYGDPWIKWSLECRYGETPTQSHDSQIEIKFCLVVFDATGEVVLSDGLGGAISMFQEGQPTTFRSERGFHLKSPLEAGTAVFVAVGRDPSEELWELIAYRTSMLDRLEPIRPW